MGWSACCSGSVTAPSFDRTVLLLRPRLAIEPIPVAVGAALATDADVVEQTRPTSRIALTSAGMLGVPHALALALVGLAVSAFDAWLAVATGVTWPAPVASAVAVDATFAVDATMV